MTIDEIIAKLPPKPALAELRAPAYRPSPLNESLVSVGSQGLKKVPTWTDDRPRLGLAVESMRRHTTDEGWQLFEGLRDAGYQLVGHALPISVTNVPSILQAFDPSVVVLQDKREWDGVTAGGPKTFDVRERFSSVEALADRPDVFKLTVLKDAQNKPEYHRESAEEIGCHAWIVYYHPRIVKAVAPYVRERHLVRTRHSVDAWLVPRYSPKDRASCLLSGALSKAYPLRQRLWAGVGSSRFPEVYRLPHPGYHRNGCRTPDYLKTLSSFKVAVCTASVYGYALRKLIEATACGCRVVTNLPSDEVLPEIDANLARVPDDVSLEDFRSIVHNLVDDYDPDFQREMSAKACAWYDFRAVGRRLATDIEAMRRSYNGADPV